MGSPATGRYDPRLCPSLTVLRMKAVLIFSGGVAIAVTLRGVWRARRSLVPTTLVSAWRWSLVAVLAWSLAWILTLAPFASTAILDHLWYTAGLLLLCPPIAVLGARRPGTGVWTAFVILPLLAVLGWPLFTVWTAGFEPQPLRLETPALLGFALVLIMGVGNYLGTRFRVSAAVYGVAVCLAVGPVSAVAPTDLQSSLIAWQLATIGLGLSYVLVAVSMNRTASRPSDFDRLWEDYRDTFGIVWGRRLQDRLNSIARQQKWPTRLEQDGFVWSDDATPAERAETAQKIEQSLRWLLRRFVDSEWIDARLDRDEFPKPPSPTA